MKIVPYPTRTGKSEAAWAEYILAVLAWKMAKYGVAKWEGNTEEELGVVGMKVAKALVAKGLITLETEQKRLVGLPEHGAFGRHVGWGRSEVYQTFIITQ